MAQTFIIDMSEVIFELGLSSSITNEERGVIQQSIQKSESAIQRFLGYDPVQRTRTEYYPLLTLNEGKREGVWEVDGQAYYRRRATAATTELQLRHLPVRSITSLSIDYDGRFDAKSGAFSTNETEGTDFWPVYDGLDDNGNQICRDGRIISHGKWPDTPGSVKIVYVAGYTKDEFMGNGNLVDATPIYEAALDEAIRRAKKTFFLNFKNSSNGFGGPFSSETLGDYSYTTGSFIANSVLYLGSSSMKGGNDLTHESITKLNDFVNYGIRMYS